MRDVLVVLPFARLLQRLPLLLRRPLIPTCRGRHSHQRFPQPFRLLHLSLERGHSHAHSVRHWQLNPGTLAHQSQGRAFSAGEGWVAADGVIKRGDEEDGISGWGRKGGCEQGLRPWGFDRRLESGIGGCLWILLIELGQCHLDSYRLPVALQIW